MERLTKKDSNGAYKLETMNSDLCDSVINVGIALRLLGKYEDRKLTPAEIEQLQKENAELKARLEKSVELPCKVGDVVYDMAYNEINAWKISLISHWGNEIHINSECKVFLPCDFGKTVFLTPEEAKQALKERETK